MGEEEFCLRHNFVVLMCRIGLLGKQSELRFPSVQGVEVLSFVNYPVFLVVIILCACVLVVYLSFVCSCLVCVCVCNCAW